MSHYSHYKGCCIGRVLHFLGYYLNPNEREAVTIGDGKVFFHDKLIATFSWHSVTDYYALIYINVDERSQFENSDNVIPIFSFLPKYDYYGNAFDSDYVHRQLMKMWEAYYNAKT